MALEFSPGWLPDGYREWSRTSSPETGLGRVWRQGDLGGKAGPRIRFEVHAGDAARQAGLIAAAPPARRTEVGGAPGYVDDEGVLSWQVAPDRVLSVVAHDVPDAAGVVRRVAESVRPDPALWGVPLSLDGLTEVQAEVKARDDWLVAVFAVSGGVRYGLVLSTADPAPGKADRVVPVLGRDAGYRAADGGVLVVPLQPGRFLAVGEGTGKPGAATASVEQLTAVAQQARFDPDQGPGWTP